MKDNIVYTDCNVWNTVMYKWWDCYFTELLEFWEQAADNNCVLTPEQETHILNMVMANNKAAGNSVGLIEHGRTFANINNVSISAISRLVERNKIHMKQVYKVQNI